MWEDSHFDICTINKCLKIANLKPVGKLYNQLSALHCVDYSEMDTAMLKEIQDMVRELFDGDRVILSDAPLSSEFAITNHFSGALKIAE